jgi:hypothetical protein
MVLRKHELEAQLKDEALMIQNGVLREENPLDLSVQFSDFLEACRRGDLAACQQLISAGVNINGKDRFDYTPLIVVSTPYPQGPTAADVKGEPLRPLRVGTALIRSRYVMP